MTYHPPNAAAAANYKSRALKRLREGKTLSADQQEYLNRIGASAASPRAKPSAPPPDAPARAPEPGPPPPSPPPPPSVQPDMTVIDFGSPPDALAVKQSQAICTIEGCTHTPREHGTPRCAITGEKFYPPIKPNAAKAAARVSFTALGFFIALFRGLDEIPEPTPVELEDGTDAARDIMQTRFPELGVYQDLLAGGYAVSAYAIRTANMPKDSK